MKLIQKFLSIVFIIIFIGSIQPTYSQQLNSEFRNFEEYDQYDHYLMSLYYNRVESKVWNKFFNKYAKKLKKNWQENKELFTNNKYKTSYARILFIINRKGEILSYHIKSSCVPSNDKIFIEKVKNTIEKTGKFDILPVEYRNDYFVFTIKLHTNLPDHININNIDWGKYGVADIEIDRRNIEIILNKGENK